MRLPVAFALAVLTPLFFTAAPARSHAYLDRAEPRVGSSVSSAPRQLSLWFTQNLEPAFSGATVSDSSGARLETATICNSVEWTWDDYQHVCHEAGFSSLESVKVPVGRREHVFNVARK